MGVNVLGDHFRDASLKSVAGKIREGILSALESQGRGEVITPTEWESLASSSDQELVDYIDSLAERDKEIVVEVMGKYDDPHGFNLSLFRETNETISAFCEYIFKATSENEVILARMLLQGICQWYYDRGVGERTIDDFYAPNNELGNP